MFESLLKHGNIILEKSQTLLYGPFSIVYGFGIMFVVYYNNKRKLKWYEMIICFGLICGFVEFFVHLIQDITTHTYFWDYSNKILNIGGRTTLLYMLFWGILSYLFIVYLYPFIGWLINSIKRNTKLVISYCLIIFMAFNLLFSSYAIRRYYERNVNIYSFITIDKIFDYFYNDKYIKKTFPHLEIKK